MPHARLMNAIWTQASVCTTPTRPSTVQSSAQREGPLAGRIWDWRPSCRWQHRRRQLPTNPAYPIWSWSGRTRAQPSEMLLECSKPWRSLPPQAPTTTNNDTARWQLPVPVASTKRQPSVDATSSIPSTSVLLAIPVPRAIRARWTDQK